jgi:hypothetical protein
MPRRFKPAAASAWQIARAAGADHDAGSLGIEHAFRARRIQKAAAVEGFADQPSSRFDADGIDHTLEFRGGPDRVAQRERRRLVRHGEIETDHAIRPRQRPDGFRQMRWRDIERHHVPVEPILPKVGRIVARRADVTCRMGQDKDEARCPGRKLHIHPFTAPAVSPLTR